MNIDRLARWYCYLEYTAFGRALERSRFAFLDRLALARRVLILGEGDGRALARFLPLAPQTHVDVLELSGEMIAIARRRAGDSNRICFRQQNALTTSWPDNHYDGVMTFFFLDCFDESEARGVIHRLTAAMTPGGLWLVSEFAIPDRGWRRWHATIWIWIMYQFFGMTTGLSARTLPPIEKLMTEAGMRRLEWNEDRSGLVRSEVWSKPMAEPET